MSFCSLIWCYNESVINIWNERMYNKLAFSRKPRKGHNKASMWTMDRIQATIVKRQRKKRGPMTVKAIARDAGRTPQTFFTYFKSIPDAMMVFGKSVEKDIREYRKGGRFSGTDREVNCEVFKIVFDVIAQYGEVFYELCLDYDQSQYIHLILVILFPDLRLPHRAQQKTLKLGDPRIETYLWILVCVYQQWGRETKCDAKKTKPYMEKLIYYTNEISRRL